MAELGAQFAWNEITLVLFTTLTPSGALAAMAMLLWIPLHSLSNDDRLRIERKLWIPLLVSMVGLVASASHLGTPSNALYVLTGFGRSPLSNEVVTGVVFLALLGLYWYYSFSDKPNQALKRGWRAVLVVSGAVFITFVAFAYSAESIASWNSPFVPATLWLNACVGGPMLALMSLGLARVASVERRRPACMLLAVSACALVANAAVYEAQWSQLAAVGNFTTTVADLVPFYSQAIIVFAVASATGIVLCAYPVVRRRTFSAAGGIVGCVLVLAGIFVMRSLFYMMHLTFGLGI